MKKIMLMLLFVVSIVVSAKGDWNYKDQKSWHREQGTFQSPINIDTNIVENDEEAGPVMPNYKMKKLEYVLDNGHAIKGSVNGNYAIINNRKFELLQFHYHSLSEHQVDGKHYPIEGHFVHIANDGRLAVLGVFYVEGKHNAEFDKLLKNVSKNKKMKKSVDIDLNKLLPVDKSYYHYLGSLTTPPLTENVEWYLFKEKVEISKEQIMRFKKYYNHNYRDVQKLNNRKILFVK